MIWPDVKSHWLPDVEVVHHGEHSAYQAPAEALPPYHRSHGRFVRTHAAGAWRGGTLKATFVLGMVVRLGLCSLRRVGDRRGLARWMVRGHLHALRHVGEY